MSNHEASSGQSVTVGLSRGINEELVEGAEAVTEHGAMALRGYFKRKFSAYVPHIPHITHYRH